MKGKEGFNILPGLLIIDGGKGQLSSARKILKKFGLFYVAIFGLVKKELLFKEDELDSIVFTEAVRKLLFSLFIGFVMKLTPFCY